MICKKCGTESATDICEKCFEPPIEKEKPKMSHEGLKAAVTGKREDVMQAAQSKGVSKTDAFAAILEKHKGEIARALPAHINADKMARIALTTIRLNPALMECSPLSVYACVIQAAQLGLDFTLGKAYMIPYKNHKTGKTEATFVPGWKGLVTLANNAKSVEVWTGSVFEGDYFECDRGARPNLVHRDGSLPGALMTHAYAVGWQRGALYPVIESWSAEKIRLHRDRYNKVGERHYSYAHFEMYARKVVLLQILKYLPCSSELAQAIELNDAAEIGRQKINVQSAIDGDFVLADEEL